MNENIQAENADVPAAPPQRSRLRRVGCWVLVVIWFLVLLLPCFFFALAINQEIVIPTGSVPGQNIRIWLIMETHARGLGVSSAAAFSETENAACLQTQTNFLLWSGSAEPVQSCECYQRDSADEVWSLVSIEAAQCRSS
ncbi:MAG: hypothetical protein IAE89_11625 [Anaerolineae bacterium]|nr:hypothetical protein [Anaerolineae bacterium]